MRPFDSSPVRPQKLHRSEAVPRSHAARRSSVAHPATLIIMPKQKSQRANSLSARGWMLLELRFPQTAQLRIDLVP
jgi:hypothetical protein